MSSAQRNRTEVVATTLDEAGHGVGADASKSAIHVIDLLPGERAEVQLDHTSPHKPEAWGHIVRRLGAPSADRVAPACPAWGRCGGCVWQHLAYDAQRGEKRRRLEEALALVPAVAEGRVRIAAVRPSPATLGYRNKGKYVAGRAGEHIVLGAYAPRSHHVIDTLGCRVVAPVIDEVATWVRGAAEAAGLIAYDEASRDGELRYVIVREAADGDVMVALVVTSRTQRAKLEKVANALSRHPAIASIVSLHNDRRDGAILPSGSATQVLFGKGALVEEIAGARVEVGPGEFLQVNRAQALAMYARVAELANVRPGTRAVDLFAGVGGIGLCLARAGAEVVAVEIDREAVGQLRRAAERAKLPLTAIAGDAGDVSRAALGDPDVVVVNPPRKGLSEATRALLAALAPPTIIYVSCGPEALGRDLVELASYEPDVIEPFDLMPGTGQVETVVRLQRKSAAS